MTGFRRVERYVPKTVLQDATLKMALVAVLILLAVLSLLSGCNHLMFCGHFVNSGIGLWNAVILFALVIYLVCARSINPATAGLLLIVSGMASLALVALGSASLLFDVYQSSHNGDSLLDVIRQRLKGRAWYALENCANMFQDLHERVGAAQTDMLLTTTYCVYASVGLVQFLLTWVIACGIRRAFQWTFELAHCHVVAGIVALITGVVHIVYCCRYYYMITGVWTGVFFLAAGLYQAKQEFPCKVVLLLLNWLAFVASLTLITLCTFSALCWTVNAHGESFFSVSNHTLVLECIEEKDARFSLARLANGDLYRHCFFGLKFMGYWTDDTQPKYAWTELKFTQLSASTLLVLTGIFEAVLSLIILIRTWIYE